MSLGKSILTVCIGIIVCPLAWAQTFSNTTAAACNSWDSGNAYTGFQRTITVSGLPSTLNLSGTVLRQVNLELGSPSCTGNLSTYYARIISPGGTIIQLFNPFVSTSTSQWMDIKLRDDSSLEPVSTYSLTTQQNYWPWDIGYYRIPSVDGFAAVNGENPNGNWTLQIAENTSSEISFVRVELVFGSIITVNDVTGSNANNDCTFATCIDGLDVVRASNNGYTSSDPNYPGSPVSGCSWNGANNNSAWFMFQATSSTAYLTLSGMYNSTAPTSADMQAIVVHRSGTTCNSGVFSVPTGGCPDDQTVNNTSYITPNGGSTSTNVYSNGITANCEFNLSGLTAGEIYYLYVDGNGGAPSSFYIEVNSGAEDCGIVLPVELVKFYAENESGEGGCTIKWVTKSEINSDYFEIERSIDGENFEAIGKVRAAGNSSEVQQYSFADHSAYARSYYRLRQVDIDGSVRYYGPVYCHNQNFSEGFAIFPNPSKGNFYLTIGQESDFILTSAQGSIVGRFSLTESGFIEFTDLDSGVYILCDNHGNQQKIIIQR